MVKEIRVKSVLNKHRKRDEWFLDDYSVNPYELCMFNCVYCYIRGSKYGFNMQDELSVKINACQLLEKELQRRARKGEYGFISISSSTEPWQPIEEKYKLTRKMLQIILHYKFPIHVGTKSTLVERDIQLLKEIDENAILPKDLSNKLNHGVFVTFSFSSLESRIAKIFEPAAPKPSERLETLWKFRENEFFAGIAYIPVLPFISDINEQLEMMIKTAKEFNASYVFVGALTLQGTCKRLYYRVLQNHFPELLPKYEKIFKRSFQPSKSYQQKLEKKAFKLCKKYGVQYQILSKG